MPMIEHVLMQHVSEPVLLLNNDYQIIDINPAALALLGQADKSAILRQDVRHYFVEKRMDLTALFDEPSTMVPIVCGTQLYQWQLLREESSVFLLGKLIDSASVPMIPDQPGYLKNTDKKITATQDGPAKQTQAKELMRGLAQARVTATEEQKIHSIIESIPGNHWWKDLNGVYLGCNSNVANSLGLEVKDMLGKTDFELPWSESARELTENDNLVIRTGKPQKHEEQARGADGSLNTFLVMKVPLRDADNRIVGTVGTSIDITEKKQLMQDLEKAKEQAEAYLQNAVEQIPGEIIWKNQNGEYLGCNSRFAQRIGVSDPMSVVGKTDKQLLGRQYVSNDTAIDYACLKQRGEEEIEETVQLPDGKQCVYLTKRSLLRDKHGHSLGMIAISFDITERRAAEQERLKMLQSFGSIVAHEMRTPLLSIHNGIYALEMLLSDPEGVSDLDTQEKIKTVMNNVTYEIDTAELTVNMILENVKVAEHQEIQLTPHSMKECVQMALTRYPLTKQHQGLINFIDDNNFIFLGEQNLFVHVLFNLIKNALYFIDSAGKGAISLWMECADNANTLHFKDTGAGVSKEDLASIFEAFYSRRYHGVGLGLAFCRLVMEQFGGSIRCRSELGEYTEFILTFPVIASS